MPRSHPVTTSIVTLLLAGCASGGVRAPATATEQRAACALVIPGAHDSAALEASDASPERRVAGNERAAGAAPTPLTVALSEPVTPSHAPWPRNAGEQLVFAQLYEPLVRIDCTGRVVPGLARRWSADSSRTHWTFVLRDGARFRGGSAVTAGDVIDSWRRSAAAHAGNPAGATIASIATGAWALDSATIVVSTPDSRTTPDLFAAAGLAVARTAAGREWPDGTTSYDVGSGAEPAGRVTGRRTIVLTPPRSPAPSLRFQVAEREDPRDILDAGADILPTASPAVAQYAATQRARAVVPLPWSRTYALALPSRASTSIPAAAPARPACEPDGARAFRTALASAVHADARGAEGPFWWMDIGGRTADVLPDPSPCPAPDPEQAAGAAGTAKAGRPARHELGRIVYSRDDATARELAERIVALAAPGREATSSTGLGSVAPEMLGTGGWRAVALDSVDFARALAAGSEPAYILALPHHPVAPLLASASLVAAAPWLGSLGLPGKPIVPLVDTRFSLIARRGSAPLRLTVDWDGTLRFDAPLPATAERTP